MRPNHILIFSRQMLSLFCLFLMLTTPAFNVSANPASDSRICVKFENAGQKHDHSITMSLELEDSYGTAAKSSSTESNQLSPDQLKTIFSKITPIHALTEKKKSIEPVYRNGSSKPRILNEVQTISIESFSKSAPRLQTQELNILDYGPKLSPASVEDELYVRFSQSMVPVGLAPAKSPPVQLRPQQPGTWRWHDDRTIIFLPEGGHWNQNTTFLARVTAGTKSQKGQVLKEEFYFEFTTGALNTRTPPKAIPNSSQIAHVSFDDAKLIPGKRLESSGKIHLFCLKFNNPVDKTYYKDLRLAVEKNTELARRRPVRSKHSLRPAYPAEIEKDEILCKLKSENAANSDCMLFVALLGQLSSGDRVRIFSDDCHKAKEWIICEHFRYVNCKGAKYISSAQEPSKQPLVLFFSNYIEPVDLGSDLIQISPPVKNVFISTNRNQLSIFGDFQTNKEYLIRISAELRDSNHTRLGKIYEQRVFIPQKKTYLYHHPRFQEEEEILTNLDPDSDKHYDLLSTGFSKLNVKVFEMGPEDFLAYCKIHQTETEAEKEGMLKALLEKRPLLLNKLIELEKPADEAKRTSIDLNECFNRGITQLLVTAEGLPKEGWKRDEFFTCHWLQCSKMDLSYWSDDENTVVSVNSSRNGEPLANVFVSSLDEPMLPLQTNSDGICILPLSRPHFLLARSASMNSKEQLIVPYDSYGWHYSEPRYKSHSQRDKYKAVLITDRTVYQPGEKIHFKGWIRQRSKDACGSWKLPEQIKQNLTIEFSGKRKQNLSLNSYGTFSGSIDIAETSKLGADNITAWTGDQCIGSRQIMLAEYRQPEFDLSVECSNSSNLTKNLPAHFVARASDYTRAKISGGACNWSLECSAGSFAPPGWKDFSFSPRESLDMHTRGIESYTDKNGESHIKASINSSYPGPIDLRVKTAVQNSNMQIREASCRQLVHSSNIYAGMKLTSSNMVAGSPLRPEFIVVDTTGKPLENVPIQVELEKYSSSNNRNKIDSVRTSVRKWKLPSSLSPVFLDLMVEDTGDYRMSAIVSSANGSNKCSQDFKIEVAAKPDIAHVRLPATPHPIELLPDKPTYEPGDIARIRIKTPISEDSYGIAIFKRAGIISAHSFQLKNHEHTLSIPIETRYMPNLDLKVFLLGPDKNFSLPKATGQEISPLFFTEWREKDIRLEVSDKSKLLKVKIVTDSDCKAPAENCSIRVCVQDFKDRPLRACEVCAIVVNEADLSLGNNPFAINLLQSFNEKLESHLFKRSSRSCQQHERELELYTPYYRYGSGLDQTRSKFSGSNQEGETEAEYTRADPNKLSSLNLRKNFSPLALFAAHLITDRNGEAKVNFKLPDSIGKYRIVAFAGSSNDQFGEVKSELTVKSPLILRPTFPRFMRVGDKSEFPVTIQNNTTKDMATTVAYRSSLSSKQQQGQGHQLIVPAMDSVRIGVKASAEHAGPADFQICALSQDASDSIQGSFIVLPASQEIKFSTKGVLSTAKQIASHQVELPEHCLSEAGGLELRFGPSRLVELTGAEIYLGSYQFQCSEQLSSRILLCSALMPCSYPLAGR